VNLTLFLSNPAGNGVNPWTAGVQTNGNAVQNQLIANLATLVAPFKQLTKPFIISIQPEMNLSLITGNYNTGGNWMAINVATSPQATWLFDFVINYYIGQGVTNCLWDHEPNAGPGNYNFGQPTRFDIASFDGQPIAGNPPGSGSIDSALDTYLKGLGKPIGIFSAIATAPPTSGSPNTYDYNAAQAFLAANYPSYFAAVWWPQNDALNIQLNAIKTMQSPWVALSGYTLPATAGGIGGG
jgi:hypothetical protein